MQKNGINTKDKAWLHWTNHGKFEGRTYFSLKTEEFDDFNWQEYISNNKDLQKDGIKTQDKAWLHWTNHGKFEGRMYFSINTEEFDNFNWQEYVSTYKDLQDNGITNKDKAWYHWSNCGKFEGRTYFSINTDEFDNFNWKEYVHQYSDLSDDGVDTKDKAWYHWVHHGKTEGRTYFTILNADHDNFNWQQYMMNYEDLIKSGIDTKEKAWFHWINHGREEGRSIDNLFEEETKEYNNNFELTSINNILFKQKYDRYGNHYFGWKGVIHNWLQYFSETSPKKYAHSILFDEWLEKLLVWGNKLINNTYLQEVTTNNYKMITFVHNPPFLDYNKLSLQKNMFTTEMILNDNSQLNDNLFNEIYRKDLQDNIILLYTLSITHKEYLYNKYPDFKTKLVSVHHPIDLNTDETKLFNIELFLNNNY